MAGGENIHRLARRIGTPLYVYNRRIVQRRVQELGRVFPGWQLCYAVKANPHEGIVAELVENGCALEVSSTGELEVALSVASAASVGVVGPGKSDRLIAAALAAGVDWLAVESIAELDRTVARREAVGSATRILLRVNGAGPVIGAGEVMGGRSSQFGIDEESVLELYESFPDLCASVDGVHLYSGSQLLEANAAAANLASLAESFERIQRVAAGRLAVVVCGLGIGVNPKLGSDDTISAGELRSCVESSGGHVLAAFERDGLQLHLDVGRYLVADAGILATEVLEWKESRGRTFVVVDSGLRSFARPVMPWAEAHAVTALGKGDAPTHEVTVVGPSCLPGDVVTSRALLPHVSRGDIVVVHSVGAYGLSMSPQAWGSFGDTKEVLVDY